MGWFKKFLTVFGLVTEALPAAAEIAKDVAPAFGASKKTQADLDKAAAAAKAAQGLGSVATKAAERVDDK